MSMEEKHSTEEKRSTGKRSSTEKAEQEAAASAEKAKKKGDLMYLGPTITGVARHGTVFKDGILTSRANKCIAELPQMLRLFVEEDKVPEAARELRKQQSALVTIYNQTAERFSTQKI